MGYPFRVQIVRKDGELGYDSVRFRVEIEEAWTDETKDQFAESVHVWQQACRLGAFSSEAFAQSESRDIGLRGVGYLLCHQWSRLDFGDNVCEWVAYDFGPAEEGVRGLLNMLWLFHAAVTRIASVRVE